jgi:hypothetical protein
MSGEWPRATPPARFAGGLRPEVEALITEIEFRMTATCET